MQLPSQPYTAYKQHSKHKRLPRVLQLQLCPPIGGSADFIACTGVPLRMQLAGSVLKSGTGFAPYGGQGVWYWGFPAVSTFRCFCCAQQNALHSD